MTAIKYEILEIYLKMKIIPIAINTAKLTSAGKNAVILSFCPTDSPVRKANPAPVDKKDVNRIINNFR